MVCGSPDLLTLQIQSVEGDLGRFEGMLVLSFLLSLAERGI